MKKLAVLLCVVIYLCSTSCMSPRNSTPCPTWGSVQDVEKAKIKKGVYEAKVQTRTNCR